MGDQAIEDLVVDEGAFHHFLMTTNSQSRSSLYGLGEHASNMTSDYEITIEMTTSPDPTTFRQIINRLINESIGRSHSFELMNKNNTSIHATSQFPSTARLAREYYQKNGTSYKLTVRSTFNFERLLDQNDTYCQTGLNNLNIAARE